MLFRKNIEPRCCYCASGASIGKERVACMHRGIVSEGTHCRKFVYDPLKRQPAAPATPDFSRYNDDNFSL